MTVRATGAGGKYTFSSDEGRNLRLGACTHPWLCGMKRSAGLAFFTHVRL